MILTTEGSRLFVRAALVLAWRGDARIARRLLDFAATEAGSALDMLKAAELATDPRMRRLFFRHALDEARHAELFRTAARHLCPDARDGSEYALIHATRQNLFAEYGLIRFLAFVHVAEARAAQKFTAVRDRFRDRPEIAAVLDKVLRDERFHVAYSRHLLDQLAAQGRAAEVRNAFFRVRLGGAWQAWCRAGRRIGDAVSRALLASLYVLVLPFFALVARLLERPATGFEPAQAAPRSLEDARRQS